MAAGSMPVGRSFAGGAGAETKPASQRAAAMPSSHRRSEGSTCSARRRRGFRANRPRRLACSAQPPWSRPRRNRRLSKTDDLERTRPVLLFDGRGRRVPRCARPNACYVDNRETEEAGARRQIVERARVALKAFDFLVVLVARSPYDRFSCGGGLHTELIDRFRAPSSASRMSLMGRGLPDAASSGRPESCRSTSPAVQRTFGENPDPTPGRQPRP